jgi:DNA primase
MATYQELKSVAYINQIIGFVEGLFGITFHSTGKQKFSSFCPFHRDRESSLRVYVNGRKEVRFHCFGACKTEWDVYDLIMKHKGCSFREAQQIFARYIGDEHFRAYGSNISAPDEKPEAPVAVAAPVVLDPQVTKALEDAEKLYHQYLIDPPDKYHHVIKYLARRGVDMDTISKYNIGFAPPYKDEDEGRALILSCLEMFLEDHLTFYNYAQAGLVRLLNVDGSPYRRYIEPIKAWGIFGYYGDYFAGRITFPVHDEQGRIHGFVGRRLDNRGVRWLKQQTEETAISTRSWLYGIDKAIRHIARYKTVIIVEGIFDYFAFYRILQDMDKPFIVSTLGTTLTGETETILKSLNIEHYIIAYDCDPAGRSAIEKIAVQVGGTIYYLGGLKEGEDPADKLKDVAHAISGFSVRHLMAAAKKYQPLTEKPIYISHITTGRRDQREVLLKPATTLEHKALKAPRDDGFCYYNRDDFLPLLRYDHSNKASLYATIETLIELLNNPPQAEALTDNTFRIRSDFIQMGFYVELDPALILWLYIAMEQQRIRRYIRLTDSALAERLRTTRKTICKYKNMLKSLGFLRIDTSGKVQKMSVSITPGGRVRLWTTMI